jgi:hypothetical protein
VFLNQFHQKNLGGSAVLLGTVVFGKSPSHPKRLVGRQFTKQYLIFNAHLRHARQILVGGDDCKQNRSARRTVLDAIGSARQMVSLAAFSII